MKKELPHRDWPTLITVFLALGGIGMMIIFSGLIGFGVHSLVGKISLYICFGLQLLNILVIAMRRHILKRKYNEPKPSKKMHRFHGICFGIWLLGALLLSFSLVCHIFWLKATEPLVMYPCVIGAILSLVGWLGLLAAFHRRRQATLLSQK